MFEYLISKYLNSNFLFGSLITVFCTLLVIRFETSTKHLLKIKRIWWRSLFLIFIIIITVCLYEYAFQFWYLLPLLVIPIVVVSFIALPHEHWIANSVRFANAKSCLIWTTAGKLLFEKAKVDAASDEERAQANLHFYHILKSKDLLSYEIHDYYLPVLEELFKMGAIKLLKNEVRNIEKSGIAENQLNLLKAYIAHADLQISDMRHYLETYLQYSEKDKEGSVVACLNMLCVADESNDANLRAKYIAYAEDLYFNKQIRDSTLVFDLLFYYDNNGSKEKANILVENIINDKYDSIATLVDYSNMLYNHFRMNKDQNGQGFALSFARQKLKEVKGNNDKTELLFDLAMLQPMLNANVGWIEYSCQIFKCSQAYLNHSLDVACIFITEVLKTLQMAEQTYKMSIPDEQYNRLASEMFNAVEYWEPQLRKVLADTPTEMLYKRKELYMRLVDFLKVRYDGIENLCKLQEEKMSIYERIIEECRDNDNKREMLHYMNVYCDEIITVNQQIENSKSLIDTNILNLYRNKYMTSYKQSALNYIGQMESIIKQNQNNKSLHFYVLYMAYYSKMLSRKEDECYYFYMFERYKVDVSYFNNPTQQIYRSIQKDIDSMKRS